LATCLHLRRRRRSGGRELLDAITREFSGDVGVDRLGRSNAGVGARAPASSVEREWYFGSGKITKRSAFSHCNIGLHRSLRAGSMSSPASLYLWAGDGFEPA